VNPFHVVFICTGNRFRSPLAERIFRERASLPEVTVESLGTLDLGPAPALPEAVAEARRLGVDLSDHQARSLATADLSAADLVLGFERMHVATAVVEAQAQRDRTFTLPELLSLLEGLPPDESEPSAGRARARIAQAAALRAPNSQLLDIPELADPLGRSGEEQLQIASDIDGLVYRLAYSLFGAAT
jgi:protein-tyrosine phosphatase